MSYRLLFVLALVAAGCSGSSPKPVGELVGDAEFLALVDGADPGDATDDDDPQLVHLSDFSAANRPGTKLIMLVAAAGWCGPCQSEAAALSAFAADYADRGVVVVSAIIQDAESRPADVEFARVWAHEFSLTIPLLIDSKFQTASYIDLNAMPSSAIIDATTLSIRKTVVGADTGTDPLGKYRALLDHELSSL